MNIIINVNGSPLPSYARAEILQTGEGQTVAALQAVAVPAHRHGLLAQRQSAEAEGQTVRQGARLLSAPQSARPCAHKHRIVQGAHAAARLRRRLVFLGPAAAAGRSHPLRVRATDRATPFSIPQRQLGASVRPAVQHDGGGAARGWWR